jgi:hypothetical protein
MRGGVEGSRILPHSSRPHVSHDVTRNRRRILRSAAGLALAFFLPSCTQLVPREASEIEVQQKVLVTFQNGDQLRGRLDLDEAVDVTVGGVLYRGRIVDQNDQEVLVGDAIAVKEIDGHRYEALRMSDARIRSDEEATSYVFQKSDIASIHQVTGDAPKTTRRVAFWSSVGLSALLLILERS